jgi:hypothetical protein
MQSKVIVELGFNWNIGKVNLNELVYRVDEKLPEWVCQILVALVEHYQQQVVERLTRPHRSHERAGLGRHRLKGHADRGCRGRCMVRRGFRGQPRCVESKYGRLSFRLQEVECLRCGARFCPLLEALDLEPYQRADEVLEKEVIAAVMDTNYRRLIEGHALDVSLGGVHNFVAGSDVDELLEQPLALDDYRAVMADGTGIKKAGGKAGELRVIVGVTAAGRLVPIGSWVDCEWKQIEQHVRQRLRGDPRQPPLLLYDGEPGLEAFLAGAVRGAQRCLWHGPRGLYHALWEDGQGKKASRPLEERLAQMIAVEIPAGDYDRLSPEAIAQVRERYLAGKKELNELIETLDRQGCGHAVAYLKNLVRGLYHQVEWWLATGIVAPKTTSRLERVFRELGRRLKRIAWGWSDVVATKLSKMILIKQYDPERWKQYWLKKMKIEGHFTIWLQSVAIA